MPYEAMIHQLQDELTRTKDKDERLRLETIIVCLLGIYQLTRAVDRIARAVDKLASDG